MKAQTETSWHKFFDLLSFGISAIFSPYVTAAVFVLVIIYLYATDIQQFLPWVGIALFFALVVPGGYTLWLIEKGKISDIHMSDQSQRKIPFLITGLSATAGAIALALVHAAKPVVVMGVAYAVNALVVAFFTLFWKISIHTALFSSVVTVFVILIGVQFAWLYLILIPLAWSRVYRHKHTLSQVIGGALIAFVLTSLVFWVFNYV